MRMRSFRPVRWIIDIATDWIGRFVGVQGIDRAMAIGASAYTALIPLLIVYAAVIPVKDNRSFADDLINRMDLSGATATAVREAFAPPGAVQSSVTFLSVGLLLFSALSFARALQRLYELAFNLAPRGMRDTKWDLLWLGVICIEAAVRPVITGGTDGRVEAIISLFMSTRAVARDALPAARPAPELEAAGARRRAVRVRHGGRRHLHRDLDAARARVLRAAVRRDRDRLRPADLAGRDRGRPRRCDDRRRDDRGAPGAALLRG